MPTEDPLYLLLSKSNLPGLLADLEEAEMEIRDCAILAVGRQKARRLEIAGRLQARRALLVGMAGDRAVRFSA